MLLVTVPDFASLLAALESEAVPRGIQFERLCRWLLVSAPEYRHLLEEVWLWNDWPGRRGRDTGIDLVARARDGGLWAIQAKAYHRDYYVTKQDLDSFLSASARQEFSFRLLIATTDHLGANARDVLAVQEKPVHVRGRAWLESLGALHRGAARRRTTRHVLSGILRCSHCGSTMSGETWRLDRSHPTERPRYTCYLRRVAKRCDAGYVGQAELEAQVVEVLRRVALPVGYAAAVDAAMTAYGGRTGHETRRATIAGLRARQERVNEMYELGRIDRATYDARSIEVAEQTKALSAERPVPLFSRQRQVVSTIVDDWEVMSPDERKRLVALVFVEIHAGAELGVERLRPHDDWLPYMQAVIGDGTSAPLERWGSERKTGPFRALSTRMRDGGLDLLRRAA